MRPSAAAFCALALLPGALAGAGEMLTLGGDSLMRAVEQRDETLFVAAFPPEDQCGEHCVVVREVLAEFAAKKGDVATVATVPGSAGVVDRDGNGVTVFEMFNITEAPMLLIYPYGRKRVENAVRIDAQMFVGLAHAGVQQLGRTLLSLLPNQVQTVTKHSFKRFMTEKDPDAVRAAAVAAVGCHVALTPSPAALPPRLLAQEPRVPDAEAGLPRL